MSNTNPCERAPEGKQTKGRKRAVGMNTPNVTERAEEGQEPLEAMRATGEQEPTSIKRAVATKASEGHERATLLQKTKVTERAGQPKETNVVERANAGKQTKGMERDVLRTIVRGAYDVQKMRIQMGNRIVANFKAKLGQKPGEKEETIESEGKELLADLRQRYARLTDGVARVKLKDFEGDELISSYTELCLLGQYFSLEGAEKEHFKRLGEILLEYAIYREFLSGVKGIGPAMAGVILSEIDITKARHPSSLWKYAGLAVMSDGRGQSKRAEHLIDLEYTDRDGERATRKSITFNPFLKTKLIGVLASSFLRSGDSPYAQVYRNYKHRLESHARWGTHNDGKREDGKLITSKGRRHNMSLRYMVKMFLIDLYAAWRKLEGLPVSAPFHEAKLGHVHAA